jgi:alpha-galactosidase
MTPTATEMQAAKRWADGLVSGAVPPVSFLYGDAPAADLLPGWECTVTDPQEQDEASVQTVTWRDPAGGLSVRIEVTAYADLPAVEWVMHLRNDGPEDTPIVRDILPLDAALPAQPQDRCLVRYSKGALCSVDDFQPMERDLRPRGNLRLNAGWGRSSSEVLPFFNLDRGAEGAVIAVGWTGEWAAEFRREEDGTIRLQAGMALTHLKLHPGEEIRTPRVLMLFWEQDRMRGHNMLRRHLLRRHRPTPEGQPLVAPLCNGNWGGTPAEVHLDNIRKIVDHDLPFEYYWIDAEWFGKPGHWMENAGNWNPRPDLYPEDGFKPISDLLHANGRKFLVWFEFERVAPGTPWAEECKDWLLEVTPDSSVTWADYGEWMGAADWVKWESRRNQLGKGDRLLNLGNPEARRFLTDFLSEKIDEWGIDCLRQDSNVAHLAYWRNADAPDRQGITEIRYVEGQYALWDELLERHPGLIIDNCASGGRRIDLESISRATPLWRTDYTVGHRNCTAIQCQTYGLSFWVPVNGTGGGYINDCDLYTMCSTMSSAWVVGLHGFGDAPQPNIPDEYPYDHARDLLHKYLQVRRFYYGDYYPLTEYSQADDAWMAYQLHLPETDEGLIVVLKRPRSPYSRAIFALQGLQAEHEYELADLDREQTETASGAQLTDGGLAVTLKGQPDVAVIRYRAVDR